MLCALIMAGGKGERFWPLSTDERPKQFLKLLGNKTMLQMTIDRLLPMIPIENIFVVTGKKYVEFVKTQIEGLPSDNIIIEPYGRNTAPCIALSAFYIYKKYKDATMIVLPSDHLIENEIKFRDTLKCAVDFVKKRSSVIVTIGMKPVRAETSYGYIKYEIPATKGINILKVKRFEEKPDYDTAKWYLSKGNYLWNSGMFIWNVSTILNLTSKYLSETFNIISEIAADSEHYSESLEKNYIKVDNISVDYGILEKAENIYVIPGNFGWDDIGSWYAVERYNQKDEKGNVFVGEVQSFDSYNNTIYSKGKPVVAAGLNNLLLIETDDMIFVIAKDKIDEIKKIKEIVL